MKITPEVKRQARFLMAHYFPVFEYLTHAADGHLVKMRGGRIICTTEGLDLGPDDADTAEREYDRWVRTLR